MKEYEYLSPKDVVECDRYPLTMGQVKYYLTMRHKNGLAPAVRKIGKRCYFRRDLLDAWIESQAEKGGKS